jgi:monothiol glutaredoxin
MWSGWPTYPQVFVKGTLIGGYDDTEKMLADGTLMKMLGKESNVKLEEMK